MGARRVGRFKISLFSPSPAANVRYLLLSLGVFSWNFWPRFKAVAHPNARLGFSGVMLCEPLQRLKRFKKCKKFNA